MDEESEISRDDMPLRFTVQETAAQTGMSEHNLRYYEKVGLLRPVERADGSGHRRYSEQDLQWIHFLICLRETRMPITEMLRYAALRKEGDAETALERRLLLETHRCKVLAEIAEMTRCLGVLEYKITTLEALEAGRSMEPEAEEKGSCHAANTRIGP